VPGVPGNSHPPTFFQSSGTCFTPRPVQFQRNAAQFREQFTYDVDPEDLVLVAFYDGAYRAMHLDVDVIQNIDRYCCFAGALVFQSARVLWKENDIGRIRETSCREQKHFMQCPDCRAMFDLRSEEDVVFHLAHHKPQHSVFRIRGPEGYLNSPSES